MRTGGNADFTPQGSRHTHLAIPDIPQRRFAIDSAPVIHDVADGARAVHEPHVALPASQRR